METGVSAKFPSAVQSKILYVPSQEEQSLVHLLMLIVLIKIPESKALCVYINIVLEVTFQQPLHVDSGGCKNDVAG